VLEQPNLVKKVIFPLEILPWMAVLSAYFHASLSLLVLVAAVLFFRGEITIHILGTVVVLLAFLPILLGLSWLLAALGVYMRDIGHIVGLVLTPMLFLSPVFYPAEALPAVVQDYMMLNPLTLIIETLRASVLEGQWPSLQGLFIYFVVGIGFAFVGAWCFEKTRRGFADVL
jgi:lipopolysaccharide transport system permease protein